MSNDDTSASENGSADRRSVLRSIGLTAGLAATPFVGGAVADRSGGGRPVFAVAGRKQVRVEITPEEVTTHWRKQAPEIQERYGRAVLETTETVERPDPENDDLPERETITDQGPWEAEIATEDEWIEAFERDDVGTASHDAAEHDYDYGVWQYIENDDGFYEANAPMNVVSPNSIDEILDSLYTWTCSWQTGWIAEYDRYAYNSDTYRFETQHDSAASSTFGSLGRDHIRMWEFGGYTSIQAHVDSTVPHEAESYLEAEREVEYCLDADDWITYADNYDLPNCCPLDHNGWATHVHQ